jgi:ABC-type dipeptide/oligopeptide/nickel transport system permease subunit
LGAAHEETLDARARGRRPREIRPRGPWGAAWQRIRRDRWTTVALGILAVVIVLALVGGAIVTRIVGHDGARPFPYAATGPHLTPVGPWAHVPATAQTELDDYGNIVPPKKGAKTTLLVLGADGSLGRDELIRLLDGGRTSLEIGLGAVIVALLVAVPIGSVAGYFGGVVDAVVSRFTETVMAFPMLLFLVFATAKLAPTLEGIAYSWVVPKGVFADMLLIGLFTSFYPTRLVRSQLLVLRNAEFVDAAHMIGASDRRILRRHLFPHLVPTLLVWGAIAVATNILLEVSLSFIGIGVPAAVPTWGSLLSNAWGTIYTRSLSTPTVWQTLFPTLAILVTVVALNQVSEGVRRALDPGLGR